MAVNSKGRLGQTLGQWSGVLAMAVASTILTPSSASAQQTVRTIQAPAPYNACNLRSAGGTQNLILGTYRNGTLVTLLGGYGQGWYRVQVQQVTGWMARQCLGL